MPERLKEESMHGLQSIRILRIGSGILSSRYLGEMSSSEQWFRGVV